MFHKKRYKASDLPTGNDCPFCPGVGENECHLCFKCSVYNAIRPSVMKNIELCQKSQHSWQGSCKLRMTVDNRKDIAWYLFKAFVRVPGEIKRSRDLRGGRWSWTLNYAQKRSWVGRWHWAEQVGRLLLQVVQVVRQQRCNGHCLSDSVQHSSWKSNCAVHKSLGNGEGTPP